MVHISLNEALEETVKQIQSLSSQELKQQLEEASKSSFAQTIDLLQEFENENQ